MYIERSEVSNWQRRIVSITGTHCMLIDITRETYSIDTSLIPCNEHRIDRLHIRHIFFIHCSAMFFYFYHDRFERKRVPDQRIPRD